MSQYEQDEVDFGYHDDEPAGAAAARRARRRRKAIAGAVGLAALLGGGAFLATEALTDRSKIVANESGSLSSLAPPSVPADEPSAAAASHPPAGARSASATPAASASSLSPVQQARQRRRVAAQRGVQALPHMAGPVVPAAEVTQTESRPDGKTMLRVVSARGDLTGQRELMIVASPGQPYRGARCTQTVRLANNARPQKKPNLLICWRTSATRSVFTVLVNWDGKPSRAVSVAALDKRWKELA